MRSSILLAVVTLLALQPLRANSTAEYLKLVAGNGTFDDQFGTGVAADGATVVIGAWNAWAPLQASGAAYVYDAVTGQELAFLAAEDGAPFDSLGQAMAIRGNTVLAGVRYHDALGTSSGAAYLFDIPSGAQTMKLLPLDGSPGAAFGTAVALADGLAIIGATGDDQLGSAAGAVYFFDVSTGAQVAKLTAGDGQAGDYFGISLAVSGSTLIVGANAAFPVGTGTGSAYLFDVFTRAPLAKLVPDNGDDKQQFGTSVGISGGTAIVGAPYYGLLPYNRGAAYIFDTASGVQLHQFLDPFSPTSGGLGWTVGISGTTAVVGLSDFQPSNGVGSALLFDTVTGLRGPRLLGSDSIYTDEFGSSVAISDSYVVVTASRDDDMGKDSGSAYLFSRPSITYCQAGQSASGCQASLGAVGFASATAATGFTVTASGVEGGKDGLFFSGTGGRQAQAWGNGSSLQCVIPPVKRTGLLTGGGTVGQCDSGFSLDFNALWTANPAKNPGPGAVVQAQLWYRDPFNTSNQTTSLSDAIEFTVTP